MFRHRGKTRNFTHNLKIATLLSSVAGFINVAGFLAIQQLTTNVTGHFAFFVDEVFKLNFQGGFIYFLYIFSFFFGSLVSSFLVELIARRNERYIYMVPASIECIIIVAICIWGQPLVIKNPNIIACALLFAMGLQNSLVTSISNAIVRTTHLTGLFTDLGIELSQLFFYKKKEERTKLFSSIKLRVNIIGSFFIGGILGGIFFTNYLFLAFLIPATALAVGLVYDNVKFRLTLLRRKLKYPATK